MQSPEPVQRAEQGQLKTDEEKYSFLLENSGDILWTIDKDYRWQFITKNVEKIVHIKVSDIIGKTIWDFVAPEYHAIIRDKLKRRLKGEDVPPYEVLIIDGYGNLIPFEVKATTIVDKNGKFIGIQGISRDITERIRTEEAVHKSEEKFRDLIENIYDWVWEADRDVVFTYSNPRVTDYLGYTPEEVVGRSMFDFMDPRIVKRISSILKNMIKQRKHVDIAEKTMISKRGDLVDFEMTANLIFAEDGSIKGYRGICRDIRDRKQAEEARHRAYGELEKRVNERTKELAKARATLQGILDTAPIGIIVVDAENNRTTFYSPGTEKIFGRSLTDTVCELKNCSYLLRPDGSPFPDEEHPFLIPLKYKKRVFNVEAMVKRADGFERTILVSSAPVKDPDGHITASVATMVDITKLKSTERELQEAKGQAEMYLDLMGHDINNLNQVGIGYLELALEEIHSKGKLEKKDRLLLDKAMETQINGSKLIENVRKLQRSREGGLNFRPIDLCDIVSELKDYYSHIPDRKVVIQLTSLKHCYVIANELIRDVFSNLIGNAIKHSSPKQPLHIDIGIKNVTSDGKNLYEISIEDNGPGIPDNLKNRLFTRFQRGKTKASGRGLGLYLVKTLLDDFNGGVSVEDRMKGDYRKGSRFVVRLPAASILPKNKAETCSR